MSLKLRRGSNQDRQGVVFAEGELVYVTNYEDTGVSPLWVGDGNTLGGVEVVNVDPDFPNLEEIPNTDISNLQIGDIITWNGTAWVNTINEGSASTGSFRGDLIGSVFGDDSSLIIDAQTKTIVSNKIYSDFSNLDEFMSNYLILGDNFNPTSLKLTAAEGDAINIYGANLDGSAAPLIRTFTSRNTLQSPEILEIGDVVSGLACTGWNGTEYQTLGSIISFVSGFDEDNNELIGGAGFIVPKPGTNETEFWEFAFLGDGSLIAPGTVIAPVFSGTLDGDITGSVFGDDSELLVDAVNSIIPGYIKLADLKTVVAESTDFADFQSRIAAL